MCVAKTKALISFAVTAKLICIFVFAYANCWFSHAKAHIYLPLISNSVSFCFFNHPFNARSQFQMS